MRLPKGLSVVEVGKYRVAKLYSTNIVEIDKMNEVFRLNTGGWETKHTKKCMNLVLNPLGLYVVQENFIWNVYKNGTKVGSFINGEFKGVL